ncbi:mesoderm induction early response protein [Rhynchospora pubera]|uniref:Mesoderm induction early response protein n=1 Tax=Rhynchospora pubera TaxID=906938 RepID=A0AAV8EDK2_9POAL|nr:mesoderm induction early response protein [Rhynchospora pubera]KAJ4785320.1 mesoderm induction early response protein [Rhynchospora pubera]
MADNKNNGENAAWEVVSVTESIHAIANPSNEMKDNEPPSDAMFMSGHFSLSKKTELESLLMDSDSKSAVEDKSYHEGLDSSMASDKSKDELDVDFIEPTVYSSSEYGPSHVEEVTREVQDNSLCIEDKGIEEKKDAVCKEEKAIEDSNSGGEDSWWLKKLGLICQKVSEDKMLCVFVATAALVGVAILSHRWQREKLQFISEEGMNSTVAGPLHRIKEVLLTNNQYRPLTHTESSAFTQ